MNVRHWTCACVCFLVFGHPASARGQDSTATRNLKDQASDDSGPLGEIIVTAQRRSESAQKVPIAVQAFSGDTLSQIGASSAADLPTMVAGLQETPTGSLSPIYLRGVGSSGLLSGGAAVLTFIDGVYQPFNQGALVFNNVASVEVDKGPQGTLFGRNATGGIVQINTLDPQHEPSMDLKLGYSNYDTITASGYATAGLTDTMATDVAVYYNDQAKGWGTNLATGKDILLEKQFAIRSKTLFEPDPATKIYLIGDYRFSRGNQGAVVTRAVDGPPLFNLFTGATYTPGRYNVTADFRPGYQTREGGVALRIEHDLGDLRLLGISSWRKATAELFVDIDGTEIPGANVYRRDESTSFTQEIQLQSQDNSRLKWVIGGFYYHLSADVTPFQFNGPALPFIFGTPPGSALNIYADNRIDSFAAFGQATATILPRTRLTLGARYTIDRIGVNGYVALDAAAIPGTAGRARQITRKPTFRAILDHDLAPNILVYASFNTGYNAGGYNSVSPGGFANASAGAISPETIKAYEVGVKTDLFGRKVRVNASAFQYDYDNLQQQIFETGAAFTVNAAKARIRGAELELLAKPARPLTLNANVAYLNTRYLDYPDAVIYSIDPVSGALLQGSNPPVGASGHRTTSAPRWAFSVGATLAFPTEMGTFTTNVNASYTGRYFADAGNRFSEPQHTVVNLSQSWEAKDGKTELTLWAKNIGNRFYDVSINFLAPTGVVGNPAAPRTYGVRVTRRF